MIREVNKTNRIYAVRGAPLATVYKVKADGRKDKVALCPEHCIVDNEKMLGIDKIDKEWYINLAKKRAEEFRSNRRNKKMTKENEENVATTAEPKTKATKKTVKAVSFGEKLMNFFEGVGNEAFATDGYNSGQKYDYTKSSRYKAVIRKHALKNRLLFTLDDVFISSEEGNKSDKMVLMNYNGNITLTNVDDLTEKRVWSVWAQGADMGDKSISKAKTLAIKDWLKANALVYDGQDEPEADVVERPTDTNTKVNATSTNKHMSKAEHAEAIDKVVEIEYATEEEVAHLERLVNAIRARSGEDDYCANGVKTFRHADGTVALAKGTYAVYEARIEGDAEKYGIEA